ncbi:MAG: hypothetical protein R3E88_09355 [Myxococcota bacterium]
MQRSPSVRRAVRSLGIALALAAALASAGCASGGLPWPWRGADGVERGDDGRWHDADGRFAIADLARVSSRAADSAPTPSTPAFERIRVAGAVLAYRASTGATLTMLRECGRGDAPAAVLARQLRIGIRGADEEVIESRAVTLRGDDGWQQLFRAYEGSRAVLVRSVTLRGGGCTMDWVLVDASDPAVDAAFERWWQSFEPSRGGAS